MSGFFLPNREPEKKTSRIHMFNRRSVSRILYDYLKGDNFDPDFEKRFLFFLTFLISVATQRIPWDEAKRQTVYAMLEVKVPEAAFNSKIDMAVLQFFDLLKAERIL